MSSLLIISVVIRLAAIGFGLVWSVVLLRRLRDWRLALFTLALGLMAAREGLTLLGREEYGVLSLISGAGDTPGILLSVMEAVAVFFLVQIVVAQRWSEDELHESERRFRALFENSAEAITLHDASGKVLYASPNNERLWGFRRDEVVARSSFEFIHPDDSELVKGLLARLLQHPEECLTAEFRLQGKDGTWRYAEAVGQNLLANPSVQAIVVNFRDITERRLAVDALRESEDRYRDLIEHSQDLICTHDLDGRILSINPSAAKLLGYEPDELLKLTVRDVLAPEARHEFDEYIARIRRDGAAQGLMLTQTRFGEKRLWEYRNTLRTEGVPAPVVRGMAHDITERKRAEQALHESEARLQAVIENLPLELWARDINGRCIIQNPYSVLQSGEMLGRVSEETAPDRETLALWDGINSRVLAGEVVKGEVEITEGERAGHYYHVTSPIRVDGEIKGILGVNIDITERKRAEEALRRSETKFRILAETAAAMIFIYQGSKYVYVNPYSAACTGYSQAELLSMHFWEIVHPEHRELVQERGRARLRGEAVPSRNEVKIVTKGGEERWLDFSASPFEFNALPSVLGIAFDVTERKRAEEALRQSEEKFRVLAETASSIIYILQDSRGIYVNPYCRAYTGYSEAELLSMDFWEIVHPEYRELLREQLRVQLRGEADSSRCEIKIVIKSGEERWIDYSASPIQFEGKPSLLGTAFDITDRKQTEEALSQTRERLDHVLLFSPAIIYLLKAEGERFTPIWVNESINKLTGYERGEVLTKGWRRAHIHPDDFEAAFAEAPLVFTEDHLAIEYRIRHKNGKYLWVHDELRLLRDESGKPVEAIGSWVDVTERREAEAALHASEERYRQIVETAGEGIWMVDRNWKTTLVNPQLSEMLGYQPSEMLGRDVLEFAPDEKEAELLRQRRIQRERGVRGRFDSRLRRRDGTELWATGIATPLTDESGQFAGALALVTDITERRRAEEMLRRQTAQLAALHEIDLEISAERDLSRVLDVATRRAAELLNAYYCSVYVRDRERAELNLVASLDSELIGLRLKEGEGLAGRIAVSGRAQAIGDYSKWKGRASVLEGKRFGPVLGAPLKWQQTVIGVIILTRGQGGDLFTGDDIQLLEQIAAEAAIAIHQATLFEEVQEGQKRLQVLSHRLLDVQEAERKRLARELHDQIGQALTAVQISLQALQPSLDSVIIAKRLEESLTIIDEALQQVHDLSLDLRPSMLDDLGLVAALRWYVDRVASRSGLADRFNAGDVHIRLTPEVETACFRIAQEAITNVLRHAHATGVWVEVKQINSDLRLLIRDDGIGFDVRTAMSRVGPNASLGLQGMRERATACGGLVEIRSKQGSGTEVQASFPLKQSRSSSSSE